MRKAHLFVTGLSLLGLIGCATCNVATNPTIDLLRIKTVFVKSFKSADPSVGDIVANSVKTQLMKQGVALKDDGSADLIVEGSVSFSNMAESFGSASVGGNAYSISNVAQASVTGSATNVSTQKPFINGVSFTGKDKENNIIVTGAFSQTSETIFWGAGEYAAEPIGREIGKQIAAKLKK
jgi:hypothetical protein